MNRFFFYLKYAWRSVWRGGQLSLFAIACIAVGVGTLVGLQSLSSSIRETLVGDFQVRAGGDVVGNVNFSNFYQRTLAPQAAQLLNGLKSTGQVQDWTGLNTHSVQITGYFNVPPTVYIVDPAHFPLFGHIDMVEPVGANFQQLLAEPNSIIISKSIWEAKGYRLGEEIEVSSLIDFTRTGGSTTLKIVGVIDPDIPGVNFDPGLFVGFGIVSQQTGRQFLLEPEVIPTTYFVKVTPGTDPQFVVNTLEAFNKAKAGRYPFFNQVRTASQVISQNSQNLQPVDQVLTYIGLIAMLIGGIGSINTMLVVVRQRTVEIATIKALGLKPRQTMLIFTWQIIIMGLLGSLAGILIGIGLGFLMRSIVEQLFQRALAWSLYPGPILTGLFTGTLVAGMFGLLPAFTAARVPPVEVLRQQGGGLPRLGNLPTLLAGILLTLGLGLIAGVLLGQILLGVGLAYLTLGVLVAVTALMYLVVYLTGKFPFSFSPSFKLAIRNFQRQRGRTAATLTVITVSLFLVSLIAIVSDTIQTTLRQTLDYNLGFNAGAVNVYSRRDEDLKNSFEKDVPGIQKIFVSNTVGANLQNINGHPLDTNRAIAAGNCGLFLDQDTADNISLKSAIQVSGRSLAGTESISPNGPQKVLAGRNFTPADMDKRVMLVSEAEANCYGIKVGDTVALRLRSNNFGNGSRSTGVSLSVIGIVSKGTAGTNFEQGFVVPFEIVNQAGAQFSIFFMQIDPPLIQPALTQIQKSLYGNFVFNFTDLINRFTNLVNSILALPLLLSLLSLLGGSILIANNVALSVLERRKEVGVLKALGAKPRRVLGMLLWESGILGLLGSVLGIGGALVVMSVVQFLVNRSTVYANLSITFSPLTLGLVIGLGVGLALVATVLSAWRAVKEKPIVVLRYE